MRRSFLLFLLMAACGKTVDVSPAQNWVACPADKPCNDLVQTCDCRQEMVAHAVMDWGAIAIPNENPQVIIYNAPPVECPLPDAGICARTRDGGEVTMNYSVALGKLAQATAIMAERQQQFEQAMLKVRRERAEKLKAAALDGGVRDASLAKR